MNYPPSTDAEDAKMDAWAAANPEEHSRITGHFYDKAQYGALMVLGMLEDAFSDAWPQIDAIAEAAYPGQPRDLRKESELIWRTVITDMKEMFGDLQSAVEQSRMDDKSDHEPPTRVM